MVVCMRNGKNILEGEENYKKHLTELLKKHVLSKNLGFLIGSGCSVGGIPLMKDTFNKIKAEDLFVKNPELLGTFKKSNDLEGYLNWLQQAMKFYDSDDNYRKAYKNSKKSLVKSIKIDYDDASKLEVLNNYKDFYRKIFNIRAFSEEYEPIKIFTTNYDLFNEMALENLDILYNNGFTGTVKRKFNPYSFNYRLVDEENRYKDRWSKLKKSARVYKIHGSIDWIAKGEEILQTNKDTNDESIIIYPSLGKHFETQQSPYSELFRELSLNLQKPNTTLFIMGYGFADDHINNLIVQALPKEDFTLIIFSNLKEKKPQEFCRQHHNKENIYFISGEGNNGESIHYFNNINNLLSFETKDSD